MICFQVDPFRCAYQFECFSRDELDAIRLRINVNVRIRKCLARERLREFSGRVDFDFPAYRAVLIPVFLA